MKTSRKKIQQDIKKYIKALRYFLRKQPDKTKIKLGNPNDKHLRTYIKNIYLIKLLFPETIDIKLSHNKNNIIKFISEYKKDKEKMINKTADK